MNKFSYVSLLLQYSMCKKPEFDSQHWGRKRIYKHDSENPCVKFPLIPTTHTFVLIDILQYFTWFFKLWLPTVMNISVCSFWFLFLCFYIFICICSNIYFILSAYPPRLTPPSYGPLSLSLFFFIPCLLAFFCVLGKSHFLVWNFLEVFTPTRGGLTLQVCTTSLAFIYQKNWTKLSLT